MHLEDKHHSVSNKTVKRTTLLRTLSKIRKRKRKKKRSEKRTVIFVKMAMESTVLLKEKD